MILQARLLAFVDLIQGPFAWMLMALFHAETVLFLESLEGSSLLRRNYNNCNINNKICFRNLNSC